MIKVLPEDLKTLLRFAAVRKLPDQPEGPNVSPANEARPKEKREGWYPQVGCRSWANVHHLSFSDGILTLRSTDLRHTVSSSVPVIGDDAAWAGSVDAWRLRFLNLLVGGRLDLTILDQRILHFGKGRLRIRIPLDSMGAAFPPSVAGTVSRTAAEVSRDALDATLSFLIQTKSNEPPSVLRQSQGCTIFRDGAGMRVDRHGLSFFYPGAPLGSFDLALHQESAARLKDWLRLLRTTATAPAGRISVTQLSSEAGVNYQFCSSCQRHTLVVPCNRPFLRELVSRAQGRPVSFSGRVNRKKLFELSKVIHHAGRASKTRWMLQRDGQQWTLLIAQEPGENLAVQDPSHSATFGRFSIGEAFTRADCDIAPFLVPVRCLVSALMRFTTPQVVLIYRPTAKCLGIRQDSPEPLAMLQAQQAAEAFLPVQPLPALNAPNGELSIERACEIDGQVQDYPGLDGD